MATKDKKDKVIAAQQLYERQKSIRQQSSIHAPDIICCDIKTPENIGSIFRVADAAGSHKIILLNSRDDILEHKKIKKISRNSTHIACESLPLDQYHSQQSMIAIELTEKSTSVFTCQLPQACAFVIGNERQGVDRNLLQQCEYAVHIPMYGVNGSMNVSHALAIVLYEWHRQYTRNEVDI